MPRLIVLNGPPGIGKSTLAQRFVEDHPLTLAVEQDVVRHLLGGWAAREAESGQLARELCLAMARTHLLGGRDVIVPQFIAIPTYLDRLAALADEVAARYVEVVLMDEPEAAERRFHGRLNDPLRAEHQRVAARFISEAGGYQSEYQRMLNGLSGRAVIKVPSVEGDEAGTYRALLTRLT